MLLFRESGFRDPLKVSGFEGFGILRFTMVSALTLGLNGFGICVYRGLRCKVLGFRHPGQKFRVSGKSRSHNADMPGGDPQARVGVKQT